MNDIGTLQFFLREKIPELRVLQVLRAILGFGVDSLDYPGDRPAFAQIIDYPEGFKQGYLISWPASLKPKQTIEVTTIELATRLNVEVLTEPEGSEDLWLVSNPDGILARVPVVFLDAGIDVGHSAQPVQSPVSTGESGPQKDE